MQNYRPTHFLRLFSFAILIAFAGPSLAVNELAQTFTLDGQLMLAGTTTVLLDSNAKVVVEILDPTKNCLLYEEQQAIDTSASDGYFSIQIGSSTGNSKRTGLDPGRSMAQIYQNTTAITAANAPGKTCAGLSYTPAATDLRYFRLIVTPSSTNVADTLSPDTTMDTVPMAITAQTLQGYAASQFLILGAGDLTQANLTSVFASGNSAKLSTLLSIPPADYVTTNATSGAVQMPSVSGTPAGVTAGQIWYDSSGVLKYYDGTHVDTISNTSSGSLSGAGTAGYVPYYSTTTTLANSPVFVSSTSIGIGTTTPATPLEVVGDITANGMTVGLGGGAQVSNTAVGLRALSTNSAGYSNTAIGTNSLRNSTSGNYNVALGQNAMNNNDAGSGNTATGYQALYANSESSYNTASGYNALSKNNGTGYNTAVGSQSLLLNTSGNYSTAMGANSLLSATTGSNNIAIGYNAGSTLTTQSNVVIIGSYTGTNVVSNNVVIADGTGNAREFIDASGDVGIGTTSPIFSLTLGDGTANDGAIMAQGYGTVGTNGMTLGVSGAGTRMFWYPKKAAFRAGYVSGTNWDDANVGNYSFAAGSDCEASGQGAVCMGESSYATAQDSVAIGPGAWASGIGAVSIGYGGTPSGGTGSLALAGAHAYGDYSVGIGGGSTGYAQTNYGATGSIAIGNNVVSGLYSLGFGTVLASGVYPTVSGNNSAGFFLGDQSSSVVSGTGSMGIYLGGQVGTPVTVSANNVMAILGGSVGINNVAPAYALDVTGDIHTTTCLRTSAGIASGTCASDQRLKTDIRPFNLGLAALQGINPKYYRYNGLGEQPATDKPELGVIAQDVEKTAPELVGKKMVKLHSSDKSDTEIKVVNYNGLIYMVINSVKELYTQFHAQLNTQDRRLASIESENSQLKIRTDKVEKENAALKAYLCNKDSNASFCK